MFKLFKTTVNKFKNNEENIQNDEVKAMNSIVALLVEAASIDGEIGNDEKNQIENILIERLNLDKIETEKILEQAISESEEQIEIWSKTNDIRKVVAITWE